MVSVVEPGVTTTVAALSDGALESLTGAAGVGVVVGVGGPGLIVIRGMGGITTAVASAGLTTSGFASATPVATGALGAAATAVGDGIERTSEATTPNGTIVTAALTGNGCSDASVTGIGVGVGTSPGAAAGDVDSGNSSAGSGNGICFKGFSGVGIDGVVAGAAGVPGVVFGRGDFGSVVGIGIGAVGDGTEGTSVPGFTTGVTAGVGAAGVPVCGRPEGVPGLTAAPGTAGGVEATGVPEVAGVA